MGAIFWGHLRRAGLIPFHSNFIVVAVMVGMVYWLLCWFLLSFILSGILHAPFSRTASSLWPVIIGAGLVFAYPVSFPAQDMPGLFILGVFLIFIGVIIIGIWERGIYPASILFYLFIAILLTTQYHKACYYPYPDNLQAVMKGTALGPWRFRILIPLLVKATRIWIRADANNIMFFFRIFILVMAFVATKRLVRNWVKPEIAAFTPALFVILLPSSFDMNISTDFPEILFMTLYLLAMLRGSNLGCLLLIIVGTINKESMVFMSLCYLVYRMLEEKRHQWISIYLWTFAQVAAWLGTRALIWTSISGSWNYAYGFHENLGSVVEYFRWLIGKNRTYEPNYYWETTVVRIRRLTIFGAGLWVLIILFWRRLPRFLVINGLVIFLIYILAVFVMGCINETRIFYPLLPYLVCGIPILLSGQSQDSGSKEEPHKK
ncbi:MAG: hypothetical protein NT106_13635 [Candidatus Sumerlaeota bacterium]|nr:hypothetical protein [Candidatus Sumerlaeota bacterium]